MKKFRMMLPMLAFVFAMVGAVAGDFLPGVAAYYKTGTTTCSLTTLPTEQENCQENLTADRPICTVLVAPNNHSIAFKNPNCTSIFRQAQPE